MKKAQIIALAAKCNVNLDMIDSNFILMINNVEEETIQKCVNICEEVYQRSMRDWRDDNCRFNLGYAHGADECVYKMTGRSFIE